MENQTKTTFKKVMPYVYGLIILTCIIIALKTCNTKQPSGSIKQPNQLAEKETKVKEIKVKIDTVEIVKTRIITKYKTIFDTIIKQAPDTCKTYLIALDKECSVKDSINNVQLNNYSNLTGELMGVIAIQKYQHGIDSLEIKDLNKTVKKEKRKKVLMSIISGLAGVGLGGLIK